MPVITASITDKINIADVNTIPVMYKGPSFIMVDMFAHSATQENLRILRSRGVRIVEPAEGVEAMKLINPLEADISGKITEILVDDGMLVEYDQPMFVMEV